MLRRKESLFESRRLSFLLARLQFVELSGRLSCRTVLEGAKDDSVLISLTDWRRWIPGNPPSSIEEDPIHLDRSALALLGYQELLVGTNPQFSPLDELLR